MIPNGTAKVHDSNHIIMRTLLIILFLALAVVPSSQRGTGVRDQGPRMEVDSEQGLLARRGQRKIYTGRTYKEVDVKSDKDDEDYATDEDSEHKETIAQVGGPRLFSCTGCSLTG